MSNMQLRASYQFCGTVARKSAKNFFYSFLLLPRDLRIAMHAIYAFFRHCDDLADEPGPIETKRQALLHWQTTLDEALDGDAKAQASWPGWLALADSVQRREIPRRYLREVVHGVSMDLEPTSYTQFDSLRNYCYHVASAVGLTCIHVWGFQSHQGRAESLAESCGIALQLTNILRDVREDALNDRIYLPQEDLDRFQVSKADLSGGHVHERLRALFEHQAQRARSFYRESEPLIELVDAPGRPVLRTIVGIYRSLLDQIEDRGYDVLSHRVRLSAWSKTRIAAQAWMTGSSLTYLR